jgi:hypothetical protein
VPGRFQRELRSADPSGFEDPRVPWLENLLEEAASTRRTQRRWLRREAPELKPLRLVVLSRGRERRRRRFWFSG